MAASSYFVLFAVLVAVHSSYAISEEKKEELKAKLVPVLMECGKDNGGITLDYIRDFRAKKQPADESVACFLACVYKKIGLVNPEGKFVVEKAIEKAAVYANDDTEKAKAETGIRACEKVNTEAVTDGPKACDLSKNLYNCFIDQKQQLNIVF